MKSYLYEGVFFVKLIKTPLGFGMNIDKVTVASNKRIEILHKINKNNPVLDWAVDAAVATWVAASVASAFEADGTPAKLLGVAFLVSAAALTGLYVKQQSLKKSVSNWENSIIEEGNSKEKRQTEKLQGIEKFNRKATLGYSVGSFGAAIGGYYAIAAVVPELGISLVKSALIVAGAVGGYTLGKKAAKKGFDARMERLSIAERVAKRHGVDINTTTAPKVAVKLK